MQTITREKIARFSSLTESAENICILTHTHPDGDALGSSTAMLHYLDAMGKNAVAVIPDPVPETLSFLVPEGRFIAVSEDQEAAASAVAGSDLLICLDFNVPSRIAGAEGMLRGSKAVKVLVDHHLNPSEADFDLIFSETEISSASELLYHILMEMPRTGGDAPALPSKSAYALMAGMTTDTNNFANSVFPSTLEMASALLASGVDRDDILMHLYHEYRENRVRAMAFLLSEKLSITGDGTAYIIFGRETKSRFGIRDGETEGLVNIPLSIREVKLSLLLTEDDGCFRVSIRSKKGISANRLAREHFNGGGHECAAGGRLYFPGDIESPEKAEDYVKAVSARFMQLQPLAETEK